MLDRMANLQPNENMAFLKSLSGAIALLILSAAILITGYLYYFPKVAFVVSQNQQPSADPIAIGADNLRLILGQGEYADQTLALQQLTDTDKRSIISAGRLSLDASSYPFLQYTINNLQPGLDLLFYWRTRDNPQQISTATLYWSGEGPTYFNLTKEAEWKGHIIEIGLLIYGDLRNQPLEIVELGLYPYSAKALWSTIWSEWTAFEGWSQRSINYLVGTAPKSILSPTIATSAWCGLAIFLYGTWCLAVAIKTRKKPKISIIVLTTIVLIGWITLDFKWQIELFRQLSDTKYLYAGKTIDEKNLAAEDGDLYAYIKHLKTDVLPEDPVRIFILHDSEGHNYWRLRAQYHLLPHNIYNYGRYPQPKHIRNGDWILLLGDIEGLFYNSGTETLSWANNQQLSASLKDDHPLGRLLQFSSSSLRGNCRRGETNIVNAIIETDSEFSCITDAPISLRNVTIQSDSTARFSSKQITMLPDTYIERGATFSATAPDPCQHPSCDDNLRPHPPEENGTLNHE